MGMGMGGPSMAGPGFGRGMGPRGGMGRGGILDSPGMGMDMGMGDGGMGFGGGYGPQDNEGPGFGSFRDQLLQMGGGGPMGPGGGLMKRFKAFRPDPAMEGRRLQVEGLPDEVEDSAVKRYFQVEHRPTKLAKLPCYYLDNYSNTLILEVWCSWWVGRGGRVESCQGSYHLQGIKHGRLCLEVSHT